MHPSIDRSFYPSIYLSTLPTYLYVDLQYLLISIYLPDYLIPGTKYLPIYLPWYPSTVHQVYTYPLLYRHPSIRPPIHPSTSPYRRSRAISRNHRMQLQQTKTDGRDQETAQSTVPRHKKDTQQRRSFFNKKQQKKTAKEKKYQV